MLTTSHDLAIYFGPAPIYSKCTMAEQMHIKCPQPIRPLKRKLSHLGLPQETHPTTLTWPRQERPTRQRRIKNWVADSSSRSQNRSDTCLVFGSTMELGSQRSRSDSFISTRNEWKFTAPMPDQTPSLAWSLPTSTSSSSSRDEWAKSPNYRLDVLEPHGIFRDPPNVQVKDMAHRILQNPRTSPPLANDQIEDLRLNLYETIDMKEADAKTRIRNTMFPSGTYGGRLMSTMNPVLSIAGLPQLPYTLEPVEVAKPDLSFGYHKNAFSLTEAIIQQTTLLKPYAIPSTEYYWPFFHVEFNLQSRAGMCWVAGNQNAGNGTHSVKSMETLLEYAKCNPKRHDQVSDSVAFSCCIDSEHATLWVHWVDKSHDNEGDSPRYVSSYLGKYIFQDTTQLCDFRNHTKNIIEYGLDQRLTKIKQALGDIMLFDPEWTARMESLSSRRGKRSVARHSPRSNTTSSPAS